MFGLFKRKKREEKAVGGYLPAYQQKWADEIKSGKRYAQVTYLPRKERASVTRKKNDGEDFGLSASIAMATQNPLLGYAVGGSLTGGLVGASISESFTSSDTSSGSCDSGGSSYDTGSSYDSGSCGGSDSGSW